MIRFRVGADRFVSSRPNVVIVAGYTARDDAAAAAHIAELRKHGVAVPSRVPSFYPVSPQLLSRRRVFLSTASTTSGEAEFALVVTREGQFVALASDHTDRTAEAIDVALSKRLCPKILSSVAWPIEEVLDHWDKLQLLSWTGADGRFEPYQLGFVDQLLHPLHLLERIPWRERPDEYIVLGGTIPTVSGLQFAERFRAELRDPTLVRTLSLEYEVRLLAPLGR